MQTPATVIGGPVSPYVRKVLAVCRTKGVPVVLDPIVPFFGSDAFSELSPLRRIPVFIDDQVSISDSTVICEYLEERYPTPAMMPKSPADRALARFVEEAADTRGADVFLWGIFNEAVINPFIWSRPRDKEAIARAVTEELPQVMDLFERYAPAEGFLFETPCIADFSVAVLFANLGWARVSIDAARWPKTMGWTTRTRALPALRELEQLGEKLMQTPPTKHRAALEAMGVPLSPSTLATAELRRGPMTRT